MACARYTEPTMTVMIDGKAIAQAIKQELKQTVSEFQGEMIFHIVYVGSDPVIDNYLRYKESFAKDIGVDVKLHRFSSDISQEELIEKVQAVAAQNQAMIIQLPLPEHIEQQVVLDCVPAERDVDVLSTKGREHFAAGDLNFFPPVTGSIAEICKMHRINLPDKNILVVGDGKLVGTPTITWFDNKKINYTMVNKDTDAVVQRELLKEADMIISGVGIPNLITPKDVKDAVVIIDAGTSEAGKKIHGDVHPDVADKSSLFTPVPGGIGPLTIAILYRNVVHSYLHD